MATLLFSYMYVDLVTIGQNNSEINANNFVTVAMAECKSENGNYNVASILFMHLVCLAELK